MSTPSIISAIQKLKGLLTREEKLKWAGIVGFGLCASVMEVLTASVIVVFAQVLTQPEKGQKYLNILGFKSELHPNRMLLYFAVAFWIIYLLKNIIAGAEAYYQNFSIQKINHNFKSKLLYKYAQQDYSTFLVKNSSFRISVVNDAENSFSVGLTSFSIILSELMVFICLISMVIFMNPPLALIIFAIGVILWVIVSKFLLPHYYLWGQRLQEAALYSGQNLLQFFHAYKEILLLGKKEAFINIYQFYSLRKSRVQAIQATTNTIPRMVIEILFVGLFVVSVAYFSFTHETSSEMVSIFGGYLYLGFRLVPGLNRVINHMNTFKSLIPCVERVYDEYYLPAQQSHATTNTIFHFKESIHLENVGFQYPNTKRNALYNVNLEIKKGEHIGIAGETGSGKSTLVDIILGLLRASEGSIIIDNQFHPDTPQWHEKIGYVPQATYLIDASIEENIAFGETPETIDGVRLNQAIDSAQLRKFINQLPMGSKTVVGERGIRLSGGERQRIAIARALYRNPEVLIFDEATSALDNETETRLMETIAAVSQNRTVIMIAHRLTTLKDCDRILIMDGGVVKQITNYHNLQETKVKNHG